VLWMDLKPPHARTMFGAPGQSAPNAESLENDILPVPPEESMDESANGPRPSSRWD